MRNILVLFLFLFSTFAFSQENDSLKVISAGVYHIYSDGYSIIYYPDTTIMERGKFVRENMFTHNSVKAGIWEYYYPSGVIKRIEYYDKGKPAGRWLFFDEKGKLKRVLTYSNGRKN